MLKFKFIKRLSERVPERFRGSPGEIEARLKRIYGRDAEDRIDAAELSRKNGENYVLVILAMIILLVLGTLNYFQGASESYIVTEEGEVYGIRRPSEGSAAENVELSLKAENDESSLKESVTIKITAEGETEDESYETAELSGEELLEMNIRKLVRNLSRERGGDTLILPVELSDGTLLSWRSEKSMDFLFALPLGLLLLLLIYLGRYDAVKRLEKREREVVVRELPMFLNKLLLLMDAGLVLSEAFGRIVLSYERKKEEGGEENYFYEQLSSIRKSMEETKSSMVGLLREFAVRSSVRELMRLSNILSDNIDKGTALSDKLEAESNMLWHGRKKKAEEEGRAAETKMTMPLAMLLMSLVLISVAPALITMN